MKIMIMSTIELKERLIDKINHINDENILAEINRLLELETENESNDVFIFNENEKADIEEAQLQIKHNQFLTHDESNKEIDEWLGK
jgi:GTP-binding protein EngB required for normal cell division